MTAAHVITYVDTGVFSENWSIDSSTQRLTGSDQWSVSSRILRGGVSDGVQVVDVNNGELSVSVLPTRGMGLWRADYHGIPVGWNSPVKRPVHPQFINLKERSGLGWLYGFNELLCRCGLNSHGAPGIDRVLDNTGNPIETELTLHGKIANLAAHDVSVEIDDAGDGTLSVTGIVDEAMLFGPALQLRSTLSTVAGSNSVRIHDEVINPGGQPVALELLYHTNLGPPFLEAGSRFVAPVAEVAPRDPHAAQAEYGLYAGPVAGYAEECFFFELQGDDDGNTAVLLKNAAGDLGFGMKFSIQQLPAFTIWKNTQAKADGYVTGLEPGTDYPNLKSFEREQGRVITLEPGQSHSASVELAVFDSSDQVARAEQEIAALQSVEPVIHAAPVARFCP